MLLVVLIREDTRALEDFEKHRSSELPCIRVLQGRMEGGNQVQSAELILGAVREDGRGLRIDFPGTRQMPQVPVEGDAPKTHDDPQMTEQRNFLVQMTGTVR